MVSLRLIFAATTALTWAATATPQDPAATLGKLAVPGCDFAFDPATGNLAAVDPKQDLVVLYKSDPTGSETQPTTKCRLSPNSLYAIHDGASPYEFTLAASMPELSIEADGTVVADGPALTSAALDAIAGTLDGAPRRSPSAPLGLQDSFDDYVAVANPQYRQITGRDLTGVPVAVVVSVEARDARARATRLTYRTLLEIPRQKIDERLAARAAAHAAALDPAKNEARAQQLERRLAALEGELKRLTDEIAKRLEQ